MVSATPHQLERAGLLPYFGMQGQSFLASTQGKPRPRDSLLIEFNDGGKRMGFDPPARVRVLVTDEWHLAIYKGETWGELYDRLTDPNQLNNLWDSAEHASIKGALMFALSR